MFNKKAIFKKGGDASIIPKINLKRELEDSSEDPVKKSKQINPSQSRIYTEPVQNAFPQAKYKTRKRKVLNIMLSERSEQSQVAVIRPFQCHAQIK